jgi:hypothetical protein
MEIVFPHVVHACKKALECSNESNMKFQDAVICATECYREGWKEYRKKIKKFNLADENRLNNYIYPNAIAKSLFKKNLYVQGLLASRDPFIPTADEIIRRIIDVNTSYGYNDQTHHFTFSILLIAYIDAVVNNFSSLHTSTEEGRPLHMYLKFESQKNELFILPNHRIWSIFIFLRPLWDMLPNQPIFDEIERFGTNSNSRK